MGTTLGVWAALAALGQIDFSGGFGTTTGLQANGNATFAAGRLRLTAAVNDQRGSCFYTTAQVMRSFATRARFKFTPGSNPMADGICFVLQRAGTTALGGGGGGQGYAGIVTSLAVKFDIYPNAGSYTGMYVNGAAPDQPERALNPGLNFHSGNIFQADLVYDGDELRVTITDTVTTASAAQTYLVDIPSVLGGATAYVGFTAATGGLNAIQEILSWTFTPPPAAPASLSASRDQLQQVTLGWSAVTGADDYYLLRGSTTGGPYGGIALVPASSTTYVDPAAPGNWF
ncbi:MAG TPA: L-type lectin-domain containing protein, partial [Planctomycetota bacterium]